MQSFEGECRQFETLLSSTKVLVLEDLRGPMSLFLSSRTTTLTNRRTDTQMGTTSKAGMVCLQCKSCVTDKQTNKPVIAVDLDNLSSTVEPLLILTRTVFRRDTFPRLDQLSRRTVAAWKTVVSSVSVGGKRRDGIERGAGALNLRQTLGIQHSTRTRLGYKRTL